MKRVLCLLVMLDFALSFGCEKPKPPEAPAKKELSATERFSLAEKCSVAGKKFYDEKAKDSEYLPNYILGWAEYHYNSRLNTCLVLLNYHSVKPDGTVSAFELVIDVFSNKVLLNAADDKIYAGDFAAQKDKLFSE